jgi:hypothetical protein
VEAKKFRLALVGLAAAMERSELRVESVEVSVGHNLAVGPVLRVGVRGGIPLAVSSAEILLCDEGLEALSGDVFRALERGGS